MSENINIKELYRDKLGVAEPSQGVLEEAERKICELIDEHDVLLHCFVQAHGATIERSKKPKRRRSSNKSSATPTIQSPISE
ncbi:MAG: hypothetical protein AAFY98_11630, partial [Verrucomicrobiota bacterium]